MKTNKAYVKRIKLTKKGPKARKKGQDHFNAKESSKVTRKKRGVKAKVFISKKLIDRFLSHSK